MAEEIGPALPPHLRRSSEATSTTASTSKEDIGPALPPHLRRSSESTSTTSTEPQQQPQQEEAEEIGPALPPHLLNRKRPAPSAPATTSSPAPEPQAQDESQAAKRRRVMGPSLDLLVASAPNANAADDADDDFVIGPRPPPQDGDDGVSQEELERLQAAREAQWSKVLDRDGSHAADADKANAKAREEWMLSLPQAGFISAVETKSRQFSAKGVTRATEQERSGWTDTPADRERRAQEAKERGRRAVESKKEFDYSVIPSRDQSMKQLMEDYTAQHRAQSLVQEHIQRATNEPVQQARATPKPGEPLFDRDEMTRRPVTASERERMLKEAATLNTRFSQGSTKKFL